MVVHLSYKFTHLAQSFRPHHHLNSLRSAFPSSSTTPVSFDFTSNVFGSVTNAANNASGGVTLGVAAGALGAGAGAAAGAGSGGAAGGAGGSSAKAGSWASHWGFQTGKSVTPGQAAQSDSPWNDDADDVRSLATSHRTLLRRQQSRLPRSAAPLAHRPRYGSLSQSAPHPELLRADEAGLSSIRLSGAEMQQRYHSAMARGGARADEQIVDREADEIDLEVNTDVLRSRRRASISNRPTMTLASPFVITTTPLASSSTSVSGREIHTTARASPIPRTSSPARTSSSLSKTTPPAPTVQRARRSSTSALPSASEPLVDLPPPRAASPYRNIVRERRPPASNPEDAANPEKLDAGNHVRSRRFVAEQNMDAEATERRNAILAAEKTGKPGLVERAVQQYLADPTKWSTSVHNVAVAALHRTRKPNDPLDRIVQLYNQLFDSERLSPNRLSYELVLKAFCVRDAEVLAMASFLEKRQKKKELAAAARGVWDLPEHGSESEGRESEADIDALSADASETQRLLQRERERLEALRGPEFDYFTPAVQIFEALGPLADRLHSVVPMKLLGSAVQRGDTETALKLFERMEKSRYQRPDYMTYANLMLLHGLHEKDPAAVLEVLDAYLAGRAKGEIADMERSAATSSSRPSFRPVPVKHRHDTEPEFDLDLTGQFRGATASGDEYVWQSAIRSLFEAGDVDGARALLDRLTSALAQPAESRPAGYPAVLTPRTVASIVTGFVSNGDDVAARQWFDRIGAAEGEPAKDIPEAFFALPVYAAINAKRGDLVNHFYRVMLAHLHQDFRLRIPDAVTVLDYNLARAWSATTPEDLNAALDAVIEFRDAFERIAKAGLLYGDHGPDFTVSTGLLGRITQTLGAHGRYTEAAESFVSLANIVRAIMRETPEDETQARQSHVRSRGGWVVRLTTVASGTLGFRPDAGSYTALVPPPPESVPNVRDAVKVVGWLNKLRRVVGWNTLFPLEALLVESYLALRSALPAHSDAGALHFSGDEWFTVLEAFAQVAAQVKHGFRPRVAFPGFEVAFGDFLDSGAEIPIAGSGVRDYEGLFAALRHSGMKPDVVRDVADRLNRQHVPVAQPEPAPELESTVAAADLAKATVTPAVAAAEEEDVASLASESIGAATSATAPSVSVEDEGRAASASGDDAPAQYPTPPATPPAYFAGLPAEAQPAVGETTELAGITRRVSDQIDNALAAGRIDDALALVLSSAQEGRLGHPDAYGRLVEQLGRQHRVAEARQIYLVAYQALGAMADAPEQQSIAWVLLEDRMIVALAQAGQLVDVGHHRDRLLQAGCAPSADAYASMILNMKDTTDDAAVALTLFEESQRLNVRPNVYLFNTLISKLSRARRAKEALEYFELMKHYGLRPSSITYGAIINACCKTGDDVSAAYLFDEMASDPDFKPRVPPYNTMIQFYTSTKPNRERALHYYGELVKAKVAPTGHTYKLLLDAYGTIGEPDLEMCQRVFTQLLKHRGVSVSGAHWASLVTAYGIHARQLDRALALFDSIAAHPTSRRPAAGAAPQPDAVVYEALLNVLLHNERADLCDQYLDEMRRRGVRMTAYVGNTLIKGFTAQGLFDRARAIFRAMADPPAGVASAGNHPVDRHPKHHHQAAQAPSGVDEPTYREPSTYEAMIRCELKAGETVRAAEVLRQAEARAFPPAVIGRLQKLLAAEGIEALPLA